MGKIFSGRSACLLGVGEWFPGSPLVLRMSKHAFRGKVNKINMILLLLSEYCDNCDSAFLKRSGQF